jgi:hypothetical protein
MKENVISVCNDYLLKFFNKILRGVNSSTLFTIHLCRFVAQILQQKLYIECFFWVLGLAYI